MVDIPATPIEKLFTWRLQHIEKGKRWDENVARMSINEQWVEKGGDASYLLPLVENPEIIEESPARARAIRMDDREAREQLKKEAALAQASIAEAAGKRVEQDMRDQRIAELEAELAAARAATQAPAAPPAAEAAPAPAAVSTASGEPSVDWTKAELLAYAEGHGVKLDNPTFASKAVIVEAILEQRAAAAVA